MIYYSIWVDAIQSFKKNNPTLDWKFRLFFVITFVNSLNLASVAFLLKFFNVDILKPLEIDFLQGTKTNDFIEYCIQFCTPFAIINYFLIFYNQRYNSLIQRYPQKKNNIALKYLLGSLAVFLIFVILSIWFIPKAT